MVGWVIFLGLVALLAALVWRCGSVDTLEHEGLAVWCPDCGNPRVEATASRSVVDEDGASLYLTFRCPRCHKEFEHRTYHKSRPAA